MDLTMDYESDSHPDSVAQIVKPFYFKVYLTD